VEDSGFDPEALRRALLRSSGGTSTSEGKRAAVATILRPSADAGFEVLLIRRSASPSDPWSGQMAFPGGRMDAGDPDLRATAVRETLEEVGLDLDTHGDLLGRLDDLPAIAHGRRTGLTIRPFVFLVGDVPELRPNPEVAAVIWAPVAPLRRGDLATTRPFTMNTGAVVDLPGFLVGDDIVWGLTYRMLIDLFGVLATLR
jgi:8-oxo-dGTP pyrophosphatase MutT (NUDIX family)